MAASYGDPLAPSGRLTKVTKATSDLAGGVTRALWVGTPGTANLVDESGGTLTDFPLLAGLNPVRVVRVSTGGTADDIWAMY